MATTMYLLHAPTTILHMHRLEQHALENLQHFSLECYFSFLFSVCSLCHLSFLPTPPTVITTNMDASEERK